MIFCMFMGNLSTTQQWLVQKLDLIVQLKIIWPTNWHCRNVMHGVCRAVQRRSGEN